MTNYTKWGARWSTLGTLLCGSALSLTMAGTAFAQDTATADEAKAETGREEILVTATRREKSVLDVPYNISALDGKAIEQRNVLDETELLRSVAGVGVIDRGARNSGTLNQIRIRGLNIDSNALGDYAVSSVASVSTYVNDTPIFANFLLRDLERVEVLRGPQGTLYGSGSLGGTVRYITRKPQFETFGGSIAGSASNVDGSAGIGYTIDGVLNVPLGSTLALRVVGSWADYPGITDYVNVYELDGNGIPVAPNGVLASDASYKSVKDADWVKQWMTRATLLWEPVEGFSANLVYAHQEDDIGGRRAQAIGNDGWGEPYGRYENGSVQLEPSTQNVDMAALEMEIDLGFATLTSSTSYYDRMGDSTSENTGFYAKAGFLPYYYNYPRPMASAVRDFRDKAWTQEVRLVSDGGKLFDYVLGAFYRSQDTVATQGSYLRGIKQWWDEWAPAAADAVTGDQDFAYRRNEHFEELAVFGELTWHATETLDFTGGFRYFDNSSKNDTFIDLPLYAGVFSPTTATFETDENDVLFKGSLSWKFASRDLLYATVSEGYRRGGTNAVPLTGVFAENPDWQVYKADTVINYEIGLKGRRGGITYDLSAFYVDWQDPQLNTATTNWGFYAVINGKAARTQGIEAQIDGYLGDALHYSLGYTYVDAKLTEDVYIPGNSVTPVALDGARLPGVPEHLLNWGLEYNAPVSSNWDLFARIDGSYQSGMRNALGTTAKFNVPLGGFSLWNATVSLSNGPFRTSLWMKNIFNQRGVTGVYTEAYMGTSPADGYYGSGAKELISLPRTVGISASYSF